MKLAPIIIAVAIYFAFTLGALALLRRQAAIAGRGVLFLLFCVACTLITRWITHSFQMLMGAAALAWIIALTLVAIAVAAGAKGRHSAVGDKTNTL